MHIFALDHHKTMSKMSIMDQPAFQPTAVNISTPDAPSLTAVVVSEVVGGESKYIAQFVEYDICVQASSIKELKERIFKTLRGHSAIAQACGKRPFECVASGKSDPDVEWGISKKIADGDRALTLQFA
jgi:hypothetical protein